jgi:formylglycine-generating enzyme required for sulfatase activity
MKKEKRMRSQSFLAAVLVMTLANFAPADTIRGISMDFVAIGNAGNPADTRAQANPYGCGAVGYNYRIGKYEVTNAQWNAFAAIAGAPTGNAGAYNFSSRFTGAQQPTNDISWLEAIQFCNYLTSGNKSKGVYLFSGNNANPGDFLGINRTAAQTTYGTVYFLPTEDEWYKAAYYKPDGSGYSTYANGTETAPSTSDACYGQSWPGTGPWNVGTGTQEQNGTFDMMGNIFEWNETLTGSYRVFRGGSYYRDDAAFIAASSRGYTVTDVEGMNVGLRVASNIPEPATLLLLGLGAAIAIRKHR